MAKEKLDKRKPSTERERNRDTVVWFGCFMRWHDRIDLGQKAIKMHRLHFQLCLSFDWHRFRLNGFSIPFESIHFDVTFSVSKTRTNLNNVNN